MRLESPTELTPKAVAMLMYTAYQGHIADDPKRKKTGRMCGAYQSNTKYSCFDGAISIDQGIALWDITAIVYGTSNELVCMSKEFEVEQVYATRTGTERAVKDVMSALSGNQR